MARLLIVRHTPSPHRREMFETVVAGVTDRSDLEDMEAVRRPALTVSPVEMLEADGYLLGSPINLGCVSGALKLAFDLVLLPVARLDPWRTVRAVTPRQRGRRVSRGRRGRRRRRAGWVKAADYVVL